MGSLVYTAITSLDGYVADEKGSFDWAAPDEEVHAFVNDLERPPGTYLLGRRMYEVMSYWDAPDADAGDIERDFAELWQAAEKVVYSTTIPEVTTRRTRLERSFDPSVVRQLVAAAEADVTVGGADLAGQALRAGLVDEVRLIVTPVVVGGGTAALPPGLRLDLALLDERRFGNGVVYLRYARR